MTYGVKAALLTLCARVIRFVGALAGYLRLTGLVRNCTLLLTEVEDKMGYGLETFSDSGAPQLTENSVYTLYSKGSTTVGSGLQVPPGSLVCITDMSDLVYVDVPPTGGGAICYSPGGGGVWFNYFVFTPSGNIAPSSNVGLQTFAPDGRLVFDSSAPAMRIAAIATTSSGDPPTSLNAPLGGRRYAVCMLCSPSFESVGTDTYHMAPFAWCAGIRGTHAWAEYRRVGGIVDTMYVDASSITNGGSMLIVDVSGL